jgi:hypothetical protein
VTIAAAIAGLILPGSIETNGRKAVDRAESWHYKMAHIVVPRSINASILGGVSGMFIRSKTVKGRTYYQVVENRRVSKKLGGDGRVRQRVFVSLGTEPTIEGAFRVGLERYFASRRGGKVGQKAASEAWSRLDKLNFLLRREQGDRYKEDKAFKAERLRRLRLKRARVKEQKAKEEERWARFQEQWFRGSLRGDDSSPNTAVCSALLGLTPPFTVDQLKAAYRRKSRECHPDHGGPESVMKGVNLAYETLLKLLESRP